MAPPRQQPAVKDVLRRIVQEMDDEDTRAEFEELRDRRVSWDELMDAIREAPPEQRAELRAILLDEGVDPATGDPATDDDDPDDEPDDDKKGKRRGKKDDDPEPAPTNRRTRPGRKNGAAYGWYVDDDGRVVRSSTAVIYHGEDEPDEVELLPDEDDEDEGEGEDE